MENEEVTKPRSLSLNEGQDLERENEKKKEKKTISKEMTRDFSDPIRRNNMSIEKFQKYYEKNKNHINVVDEYDHTMLMTACTCCRADIVEILLQNENIDVNQGGTYSSALSIALSHLQILKLLLQHPKINPNLMLPEGKSCFQIACSRQYFGSVELLLEDPRVDPNLLSANGRTAFFEACSIGKKEVIEKFLKYDKIDCHLPESRTNATPFYIVCEKGHLGIVSLLLLDPKVNVNHQNKFSSTPLYVACQNGKSRVVGLLLKDSRVDINLARENGMTPFGISCYYGFEEIVKLFLSSGRDIEMKVSPDGKTAFDIATERNHKGIMKLLKPNGFLGISLFS